MYTFLRIMTLAKKVELDHRRGGWRHFALCGGRGRRKRGGCVLIVSFLVLFIFASELLHTIAVDQQQGLHPHPLGASVLSGIGQGLLLALCIWYCGWLWGAVLFLGQFFAVVHATMGWLLMVPLFFVDRSRRVRLELALMIPTLLLVLVFSVVSFLTTPFAALYSVVQRDWTVLLMPAVVVMVCGFVRILLHLRMKHINKRAQEEIDHD
jgi:hypothetical protein